MLAALRDTNGVAVAVDGRGAGRRAPRLARLEGLDLGPTAAGAGGLVELRPPRRRGPDESVLIATTGGGLKVPDERVNVVVISDTHMPAAGRGAAAAARRRPRAAPT